MPLTKENFGAVLRELIDCSVDPADPALKQASLFLVNDLLAYLRKVLNNVDEKQPLQTTKQLESRLSFFAKLAKPKKPHLSEAADEIRLNLSKPEALCSLVDKEERDTFIEELCEYKSERLAFAEAKKAPEFTEIKLNSGYLKTDPDKTYRLDAHNFSNQAIALYKQNRFTEAQQLFQNASDRLKKIAYPNPHDEYNKTFNLDYITRCQGSIKDLPLEEKIKTWQRIINKDNDDKLRIQLLLDSPNRALAETLFQKSEMLYTDCKGSINEFKAIQTCNEQVFDALTAIGHRSSVENERLVFCRNNISQCRGRIFHLSAEAKMAEGSYAEAKPFFQLAIDTLGEISTPHLIETNIIKNCICAQHYCDARIAAASATIHFDKAQKYQPEDKSNDKPDDIHKYVLQIQEYKQAVSFYEQELKALKAIKPPAPSRQGEIIDCNNNINLCKACIALANAEAKFKQNLLADFIEAEKFYHQSEQLFNSITEKTPTELEAIKKCKDGKKRCNALIFCTEAMFFIDKGDRQKAQEYLLKEKQAWEEIIKPNDIDREHLLRAKDNLQIGEALDLQQKASEHFEKNEHKAAAYYHTREYMLWSTLKYPNPETIECQERANNNLKFCQSLNQQARQTPALNLFTNKPTNQVNAPPADLSQATEANPAESQIPKKS